MSTKNKLVDFRAVREAVSMEQILSYYGLLDAMKRSGDNLSGCCPIHKGPNPTQFRVSVSKNVWNCFSECKRGGNAVDFIASMEDVSPYAAAQKAIEWFHLDPERVYTAGDRAPNKPGAPPAAKESVSKPVPVTDSATPTVTGPRATLRTPH